MSQVLEHLDPYDRLVKETLDKRIPFKVDWELTYRCNLKCRHCYQTGPTKEPELPAEKIFSLLDELADLGCLYLTFTGGEILLRQDFFAIAGYARKKGFAIRIFTNGTLLDDAIAEEIRKLNPLAVEISLYATDPALHESITGVAGSFVKTVNAFRLLQQRKIRTVVKTTFIQDNIGEFDKLNQFAQSINSAFNFSFTLIPKIDGSTEVLKLRLSYEQLKEVFNTQRKLVNEIAEGGVKVYEPLCAAGFNSLYLSPYGEVFPCVVLREDCGKVQERSLKSIWEGKFFTQIRAIGLGDLKKCLNCSLSGYCDRCAGLAWLEAGDLFGPSPNDCTLAKVRQEALAGQKEKAALALGRA